MADDSVLGQPSDQGRNMVHPGSWNPAFRPEDNSQETNSTPPVAVPTLLSESQKPIHEQDINDTGESDTENEKDIISQTTQPRPVLESTSSLNYASPPSNPTDDLIPQPEISHEKESVQQDSMEVDRPLPFSPASLDPLSRADIVSRTNSFPTFDANSESVANQYNQSLSSDHLVLSHQDPIQDSGTCDDIQNHTSFSQWNDIEDGEEDYSFFDQVNTQTKPIYIPPEAAEARFESGLPLVDNNIPSPTAESIPKNSIDAIFEADGATEDLGLFKVENGEDQLTNGPPSFHRKQTSQVLQTLNMSGSVSEDESPVDLPHTANSGEPQPETLAADAVTSENLNEEELAERWKAMLDDDDLLVDEDLDESIPNGQQTNHLVDQPAENTGKVDNLVTDGYYDKPEQPPVNLYTPHQPSSTDMVQGLAPSLLEQESPALSSKEGVSEHTESFSNQSKAGYKSPYDLPSDMRPKRTHRSPRAPTIPPPRSNSMTEPQPAFSHVPPPPMAKASVTSNVPATHQQPPSAPTAAPTNFFEDLPVTSRSRPGTSGRYTPQQNTERASQADTTSTIAPPPPQKQSDAHGQFQLQEPERTDPYSNLSVPSLPAVPKQSARYSPKPPSLHAGSKPPSIPRYSPAPPQASVAPPPPPAQYTSHAPPSQSFGNSLPFQPRTSSPLAQPPRDPSSNDGLVTHDVNGNVIPPVHQSLSRHATLNNISAETSVPTQQFPTPDATSYIQASLPQSPPSHQISPPKRSQTQSPGKGIASHHQQPLNQDDFPRPASVHGSRAPLPPASFLPSHTNMSESRRAPPMDFIPPTDGQECDPLERWKGAPIVKFGFGGTILTSFPKHVPRYSTGQLVPRIKATLGDIKSTQTIDLLTQSEAQAIFPGPLRSKSKKKDVMTWISNMISMFENEKHLGDIHSGPLDHQRQEEKVLLWKVVQVMVDHDGVLQGNTDVEKSLRDVLSSLIQPSEPVSPSFGITTDKANMSTSHVKAEPTAMNLDSIRQNLLLGEREKAVWSAVDNRLWGHAMLLSSTLSKSVWKQVVQEFIRREVRSLGENTESLAALYEVFAGNFEESVDELVPPSARAGLQMVSMGAGHGPAKNGLDGLNKWRDTLSLILNNRSNQDQEAIMALGRLLSSYGRVEASHICFLIATSANYSPWGGVNEPQADIVLLGADHRHYPFTFMSDPNSYLLSEVYEFAVSVLAASPSPALPHLQVFKLNHAIGLAEKGQKSEAQQYCEAIGSTLKPGMKPSPYYNQTFFSSLEELSNRLRQAPTNGSSSWMSKPSMEKVSGSMWTTFTNFVAGEDSDAASTESKALDADRGPFAKVANSPPIGQSPSGPDSYGSYFASGQHPHPAASSSSRYAPGGQYASYSPSDQQRGRRSLDSQRSPSQGPAGRSFSQRRHSQDPPLSTDNNYPSVTANGIYTPATSSAPHLTQPQAASYSPLAPVEEISSSQAPSISDERPPLESSVSYGGQPQTNSLASNLTMGMDSSPEVGAGYTPPSTNTGYEPPPYQPAPTTDDEDEQEKSKKKSFMDDDNDDDIAAMAAKVRETDSERKAREAADIVKKAAEEDAKKPANTDKKGWFSGWFGKKEATTAGGPIRAKLGENSSFYYDKDLERWVNKKDPDSTSTPAQATPPPPKSSAPPSRSASGLNPPSSAGSGMGNATSAAMSIPPSGLPRGLSAPSPQSSPSNATPPPSLTVPLSASPHLMPRSVSAGAPSIGPPSRPGTALSNASSIDDLLGAPQSRKANTVKARKKGRGYVDVMAK